MPDTDQPERLRARFLAGGLDGGADSGETQVICQRIVLFLQD